MLHLDAPGHWVEIYYPAGDGTLLWGKQEECDQVEVIGWMWWTKKLCPRTICPYPRCRNVPCTLCRRYYYVCRDVSCWSLSRHFQNLFCSVASRTFQATYIISVVVGLGLVEVLQYLSGSGTCLSEVRISKDFFFQFSLDYWGDKNRTP